MGGTNPIVTQSRGKRANHYRISKRVLSGWKKISNQNLEMKDKGKKAGQSYIA